jgi:hypothetical protein
VLEHSAPSRRCELAMFANAIAPSIAVAVLPAIFDSSQCIESFLRRNECRCARRLLAALTKIVLLCVLLDNRAIDTSSAKKNLVIRHMRGASK